MADLDEQNKQRDQNLKSRINMNDWRGYGSQEELKEYIKRRAEWLKENGYEDDARGKAAWKRHSEGDASEPASGKQSKVNWQFYKEPAQTMHEMKNHIKDISDKTQASGNAFGEAVRDWFRVHPDDVKKLTEFQSNIQSRNKGIVFGIGVLLTPVTLIGVLLGYIRAYNRFEYPKLMPYFGYFHPIFKFAMFFGAILAWVFLVTGIALFFPTMWLGSGTHQLILVYLGFNIFFCAIVMGAFALWRYRTLRLLAKANMFGSARFASEEELEKLKTPKGLYIGGGLSFDDSGHLLTVAGTRGGKGVNLILPNLLGMSDYSGSMVVIDPKCENAVISARYQREQGQNVVILNPWGLHGDLAGTAHCYNPLDLLADIKSPDFVDDIQIIAEMIVPIEKSGDRFWPDAARSVVTGLLLYMMVTKEKAECTLETLWNMTRLSPDDWQELVAEMRLYGEEDEDENADSEESNLEQGEPVQEAPEAEGEDLPEKYLYKYLVVNFANEILRQMESMETFSSIISHVMQATDFLKSPALQKSMQSGFDPYTLADGKTTLYVVIPADKLQSHSRWLRLVVTSLLRAVIRKPKNRVTFLLDEFAALGYLPEIETALSTYAGYNVTVWPILQSLIQLKRHYGDNWESFNANTAVRHFFNINDNFSADYISKALGQTSNMITNNKGEESANTRALVTPDELRRHSGDNIFTFIGNMHPTRLAKRPYYEMAELKGRFDRNPYF